MNGILNLLLATSVLIGGAATGVPTVPAMEETTDYKYLNKIDYIFIEPVKQISLDTRMIVKVSFAKELTTSASLAISTINDEFTRGIDITTLSINSKEATLTYSYDQRYTKHDYRKNVFKFFLTSEYGTDSMEIDMPSNEIKTIIPEDEDLVYESPLNIALYKRGKSLNYYKEKLTWHGCVSDVYYSKFSPFSFGAFRFEYESPDDYALQYDEPKLVIVSDDVLFPNLGKGVGNGRMRFVPLTIAKLGKLDIYYLTFKDKMYVHPTTLDMSSTKKSGYVKTSNLYFPAHISKDTIIQFSFSIPNIGANSYQFSHTFKAHISKKAFGNCIDSTFCMSTEEAEPDTTLGERIIH